MAEFHKLSDPTKIKQQTEAREQLILGHKRLLQGPDGGVLIPADIVFREIAKGSLLGDYLFSRTMAIIPTTLEVVDNPFTLSTITLEDANTYRTSIDKEAYYDANHTKDITLEQRHNRFITNVYESNSLLQNWDTVVQDIKEYNEETQTNIYAVLLRNLSNDFIGLSYGAKVSALERDIKGQADILTTFARLIGTANYRTLITNTAPQNSLDEIHQYFNAHEAEMNVMALAKNLTTWNETGNYELIRTRRETDTGLFTVAAALAFFTEFGDSQPDVLIPMLGALDLGYALEALGYPPEKIHAFLPVLKEKTAGGRRPKYQPLEKDILALKDKPCVIFEDTIGDGDHMLDLLIRLRAAGINIEAIRFMFLGVQKNGDWANLEALPHTDVGYYYLAFIPTDFNRQDSTTSSTLRLTTLAWWQQLAASEEKP